MHKAGGNSRKLAQNCASTFELLSDLYSFQDACMRHWRDDLASTILMVGCRVNFVQFRAFFQPIQFRFLCDLPSSLSAWSCVLIADRHAHLTGLDDAPTFRASRGRVIFMTDQPVAAHFQFRCVCHRLFSRSCCRPHARCHVRVCHCRLQCSCVASTYQRYCDV